MSSTLKVCVFRLLVSSVQLVPILHTPFDSLSPVRKCSERSVPNRESGD